VVSFKCRTRNPLMIGSLNGDDPFVALSDPTRRRILELLTAGERPASDFTSGFSLAKQTVSRHLQVLRHLRVLLLAGLVDVKADRQWRYYTLNRESLAAIEGWFRAFRPMMLSSGSVHHSPP
jgi:DNA-binding transcriptional ArsR family regulator